MLRAAVTSNGPCHKHHGAWFRSVRPSFGIKFPMIASGGLMLAGTKRRSPTWQLSLLLVIFGGVVGYSCFENLDIWGNGRQHQALYGISFFAGIVVFISGIVRFLAIAVKAVASLTGSGPAIAARSP